MPVPVPAAGADRPEAWRPIMPGSTAWKAASAIALAILAGGLGGCTATADLSYSEYEFGPGFQTERVYESRVFGDTGRGFGSEACRTVVRRETNAFGEVFTREIYVCDEP